jgi:6-pyruvoyltetrahydropterin/6-carboxytetrahydropterin synthase
MYSIGVQRDFIAQHYLISGDFGPENHRHSHHYRVEVRLSGQSLDAHGFLIDLDRVSADLDAVLAGVRDKALNDLPEFAGLNPSIEHLARMLCHALRSRMKAVGLREIRVALWESATAWAAYAETF